MAIRISKVYTRTGDAGDTRLLHNRQVSKASLRVEAYGATDELGAHIGYLATMLDKVDLLVKLRRIQQELFDLGALLATLPEDRVAERSDLPDFMVDRLEQEMDVWNEDLPVLKSFVLAGGGPAGAYAHVCRTECRRAERIAVALAAEGPESVPGNCLKYLNRLSDYLFVLARHIGTDSGHAETLWEPGRTDR